MQREFLFRAKLPDGKWIQSHSILQYNNKQVFPFIVNENGFASIVEYIIVPGTLVQFTGMLDSEGVKIFEGDEVEFTDYKTTKRAIVEWNKRAYAFVLKTGSYGKTFTRLSGRGKLKIVSHTHD